MFLLPDWAPNAHPLILHFPIALAFMGGAFDLIGILAKDRGSWRTMANWLYATGALAAVATWYSGTLAADSVFLPTEANALLTEHADLGLWTAWFFGGYGVLRTALAFTRFAAGTGSRLGMFVLGVGGLVLITITATHGAELVYRHGVGVEAVETRPTAPLVAEVNKETGLAATDAGWMWAPARASAWKAEADFIEGSAEGLKSSLVDGGELGDVIELAVTEPTLFVLPGTIDRLQVDLMLDVSEFDGTVLVAHHVQDDGSYGFTSVGDDLIRLGKTDNGDLLVEATEAFDGSAWRDIRVVVDGTHFRSYVDTQLAIHGHGGAFQPGRIGLRLNGTGSVRLARMQAVDIAMAAGAADAAVEAEANDTEAPAAEHDH